MRVALAAVVLMCAGCAIKRTSGVSLGGTLDPPAAVVIHVHCSGGDSQKCTCEVPVKK